MSIEALYEQHSDAIYTYIYYLVGEQQLAEDLTHDTFLKVMKQLHTFRAQSTEKTWLTSIARNTVYDHFRKGRKFKFLPFLKEHQDIDHTYVPESWLETKQDSRALYEALGQLKMAYRNAIVLRKIEGYSIKETAAICRWTEAQVKNNTERGLKALAELLGGYEL